MSGIVNTRLRFVRSKDPDIIIQYFNNLAYKVELKGGMIFGQKKWHQSFVLPEDLDLKEALSGDLD